jgi:hypothetical protein
MNDNKMTYTEVVERRAEIRKAMTEIEVMRRERTVAEQGVFQENLLNEHNRHRKVIEEIESDTMKRKAELRNEMERINPTAVVAGANCPATISIVDFKGARWVRVQALGEDFVVAPEDLDDGADHFSFDSAQEKLKELELATFNRKQGFIIATLIEEINAKLVEAGGDKFAEDVYVSSELWKPVGSCADCGGGGSWCFDGYVGCFGVNGRYYGGFRCRPVLAYTA